MKVAIGIPILDSVPGEAFESLVGAIADTARKTPEGESVDVALLTALNTLPHDRARASITERAIRTECDLLYFIDDDMIIPTDAFPRLLKVMKEEKVQVVSGHYYRRGYPYTSIWAKQLGEQYFPVDADSGVHQIHFSGLGCALIDLRWITSHLEKPYYTMGNDGISITVNDDTHFFDKIKAAGGIVLGHGDVRCGHLGSRTMIYDRTVVGLRKQQIEHEHCPDSLKLDGD